MPGAGEYRGRDVIVDEFLKPIRGMFAEGSPSNRDPVDGLEGPAGAGRDARHRASLSDGRPYDNRYAWAFEVRDGKIAEIREYLDSYYIVRLFGKT